jgi:hypothetical protein
LEAAASSVEPDAYGTEALVGAYGPLRTEALLVIDEGLRDEFARLFPETAVQAPDYSAKAREAKLLLDQMAGWIGGIIEEALIGTRIEAGSCREGTANRLRLGARDSRATIDPWEMRLRAVGGGR